MKLRFRELITNDLFPFFVLGVGILIIHMFLPVPVGDDIWFSRQANRLFDWSFYFLRYLNWSSRLIIEFLVIGVLDLPSIIWRVVNPFIFVMLGLSISKLFVKRRNYISNWFVVFLIFLFPLREISDAGWVTTSVNYLWTLTFGLFSIITLNKAMKGEKISVIEYVISLILLIISINHEIICAVFTIVHLVLAVYLIKNQRSLWYIFLRLLLSIIGLIFILASPGNIVRRESEIRWFIDFNNISLINKLEIGLSSTMSHYLFEFNIIFLIFVFMLFIMINRKYKDGSFFVYSFFPLFSVIIFGFVLNFVPGILPHLDKASSQMTKYGLITLENFTKINSYLSLIILYFTFLLVLVLLFLSFDKTNSFIALGIFLLGMLSRLPMSLSPSIWASGKRTFFPLTISIVICCVMLFQELGLIESNKNLNLLVTMIGFLAGVFYFELFMSL
jgi:hypothetical protein